MAENRILSFADFAKNKQERAQVLGNASDIYKKLLGVSPHEIGIHLNSFDKDPHRTIIDGLIHQSTDVDRHRMVNDFSTITPEVKHRVVHATRRLLHPGHLEGEMTVLSWIDGEGRECKELFLFNEGKGYDLTHRLQLRANNDGILQVTGASFALDGVEQLPLQDDDVTLDMLLSRPVSSVRSLNFIVESRLKM